MVGRRRIHSFGRHNLHGHAVAYFREDSRRDQSGYFRGVFRGTEVSGFDLSKRWAIDQDPDSSPHKNMHFNHGALRSGWKNPFSQIKILADSIPSGQYKVRRLPIREMRTAQVRADTSAWLQ